MPPDRAPLRAEDLDSVMRSHRADYLLAVELNQEVTTDKLKGLLEGYRAGFAAGIAHGSTDSVQLSPATLAHLKEITHDWPNTFNEIVEGAVIAGIRAWEEDDKRMRQEGWVVRKLGPGETIRVGVSDGD